METISIALLLSVIGVCGTVITVNRNKSKDIEEKARSDGKIEAKLDFISQSTTSLQADFKNFKADYGGMNERLIKCEESTKSAHHRIDSLEENKKGE